MTPTTRIARLVLRFRTWRAGWTWRAFALALPALLALLGVAGVIGTCLSRSAREQEIRYLSEGKAALEAKNYGRAKSCFERLLPTTAGDDEVTYLLALAAEGGGDTLRAGTLMRGLASADGPGYALAHYWWARRLLAAPPSPAVRAAAERHLLLALNGDIDEPNAHEHVHGLLGVQYLSQGRLADAEPHLLKAVSRLPAFRIPLARVYLAQKNAPRARQEAELAARFYSGLAKQDLSNVSARLAWADALTFLEDFSAALKVLADGLQAAPADVYRLAQAKVYASWFDHRKATGGATPGELLVLLDKGLALDPANLDLLDRLLTHLSLNAADTAPAREVLLKLLAADGTPTARVHFALAVEARLRNHAADEVRHLELAYKLDPNTPLVANNLAWVLSNATAPDLPRAAALAELAVRQAPDVPSFRDTRGRIYLGLGRWAEAVADLELVLRKAPGTDGLHAALAVGYENLGQTTTAAEHRRLADQKNAHP